MSNIGQNTVVIMQKTEEATAAEQNLSRESTLAIHTRMELETIMKDSENRLNDSKERLFYLLN